MHLTRYVHTSKREHPHAIVLTSAAAINGALRPRLRTFRRDYESRMDLSDAPTVLAQLAAAFEHFNEVHPHSSLKMRSPRQFRRQRAEQMRRAQLEQPALHCE